MIKKLALLEQVQSGKQGTQNASTLPLSPCFINYCSFLGLKDAISIRSKLRCLF